MMTVANLLEEKSIYHFIQKIDGFWNTVRYGNKNQCKYQIEKILSIYGTKLYCNRFDVGNMIEYSIGDYFHLLGYHTVETPNCVRFDIDVSDIGKFSIKYSSCGDITLHNSNRHLNRDVSMQNTILITDTEWWLLLPEYIEQQFFIKIADFTKNHSDSLSLQRKILNVLKSNHYPYWFPFVLENDKKKCLNRPCSKDLYHMLFGTTNPTV